MFLITPRLAGSRAHRPVPRWRTARARGRPRRAPAPGAPQPGAGRRPVAVRAAPVRSARHRVAPPSMAAPAAARFGGGRPRCASAPLPPCAASGACPPARPSAPGRVVPPAANRFPPQQGKVPWTAPWPSLESLHALELRVFEGPQSGARAPLATRHRLRAGRAIPTATPKAPTSCCAKTRWHRRACACSADLRDATDRSAERRGAARRPDARRRRAGRLGDARAAEDRQLGGRLRPRRVAEWPGALVGRSASPKPTRGTPAARRRPSPAGRSLRRAEVWLAEHGRRACCSSAAPRSGSRALPRRRARTPVERRRRSRCC